MTSGDATSLDQQLAALRAATKPGLVGLDVSGAPVTPIKAVVAAYDRFPMGGFLRASLVLP